MANLRQQIHGFPDLAMGWRYQIPFLIEEGFRVVAPDTLGYGRTVCLFA
jgi:soluble epoxide hydrolase/lipid-phosphate phosphatase